VPGATFNETELRVDLPNGSRIRLYGADNPDRLRGIYLDGVILDEYADMRPSLWGEVIRPLLADRKGWAVFIGTPKGHNAFYETYRQAKDDNDWLAMELRASVTGLIDSEELDAARRQMSEDSYQQEFECSFEAAIAGAYFGKEMRRAEEDGRICPVPYDPSAEVYTAWDLGIGDSTAIWFSQMVGREVRIIDYYENSGVGVEHYIRMLKDRDYNYAEHLLPHDADKSELGTGKSIREVMGEMGVRRTRVVHKLTVEEGIQQVRLLIPRVVFDAKRCASGIESLKQYRREWDDKLRTFKSRPLHDLHSHAADAFRYLAVGLRKVPQEQRWGRIEYAPTGIV